MLEELGSANVENDGSSVKAFKVFVLPIPFARTASLVVRLFLAIACCAFLATAMLALSYDAVALAK